VVSHWWTKPARKAVEQQFLEYMQDPETLEALELTEPMFIAWPGFALPKDKPLEYVRFSFHPSPVAVRTMGPNGRREGSGFAKFGVFTRLGESQDRNDTIAGVVAQAFPYNLNLVREGIRVNIDTTDHTQFVMTDAWGYSPVDVNWNVWRTN
jgi:hypothetical protein